MIAPLHKVAVRAPGPSMLDADRAKWHYGPTFDPGRIGQDHKAFVALLERAGADVLWMTGDDRGIADAVFTYDASLMTPEGAVLMSPGKSLRMGEQHLHAAFYKSQGIPVLGAIEGAGRIEAGDTLWLDDTTLAVGKGFRTNQEGCEQLAALLGNIGISAVDFDMPVYRGRDACLHLMSVVSLVAERTALVCEELMPVPLWILMQEMGFTLLPAPFDEFDTSDTMSLNVLATAPGECIAVDGFPKTKNLLEEAGIRVSVFDGTALCIGAEGGPTCMTRPIERGTDSQQAA